MRERYLDEGYFNTGTFFSVFVGAIATRRWTVQEWDIDLSDQDDDEEDDDGEEDDDSTAGAIDKPAKELIQEKQKMVKLQHTSITSDSAVKQRRWYTWEGVDLVALGYESESDSDDDATDSIFTGDSDDSEHIATLGNRAGEDISSAGVGVSSTRAQSEAMKEIEDMVVQAIEKGIDNIGFVGDLVSQHLHVFVCRFDSGDFA